MKACCAKRKPGKSDVGGWLVSGGLFLLIPKCPACLAAYVAAFTGLGLSLPTAAGLRWGMIGLCGLAMGILAGRLVSRCHVKRR